MRKTEMQEALGSESGAGAGGRVRFTFLSLSLALSLALLHRSFQVGLTVPGRPRTSRDARPYLETKMQEAVGVRV
jgi:hypothetical protein